MTALNFLVTITMRAPGMIALAHAAARLGELHDATARRDRNAVHRRVAVLRHVRQGDAHELLQPTATCSATFWFYSHPAVYIMMLPGFGIASEVISDAPRRSSATA